MLCTFLVVAVMTEPNVLIVAIYVKVERMKAKIMAFARGIKNAHVHTLYYGRMFVKSVKHYFRNDFVNTS